MALRSKMEKDNAESESSSSPSIYQCIVCQMPSISLSRLHRHQTYQHTSEELSLSTIGLQCSLINNLGATNRIVYDNSWLCDPLKQARFYTVSANLLNDCNNNPDNSAPIDYVVKKYHCNFKEDSVEIANERAFDIRVDHSYGRALNFPEEFLQNKTQTECLRNIVTETNGTRVSALCTETERIIAYLEKVMGAKRVMTVGSPAHFDSKSKIIEAEEGRGIDGMPNDDLCSQENPMQALDFQDISKVIDSKESGNIVSEANCISQSWQTGLGKLKAIVPEVNGIVKSDKKVINAVEPDSFANCVENLCIDLEKLKKKPRKLKRAPLKNLAPRKAKAAAKPRGSKKKANICGSVKLSFDKPNNSVEYPKKKVRFSDSVAESTTIMQNGNEKIENSKQHDSPRIKHTALGLESHDSEEKNAKSSKSGFDDGTVMREADIKTEFARHDKICHFPSIDDNEPNLHSEKSGNSVDKIFFEQDTVEAQLRALFQQQDETQETEISMIDKAPDSQWIDYDAVKMEPPFADEVNLAHDNFIQHYVDTCKAEIPAEIPIDIKSEGQQLSSDDIDDPANSKDSVILALPSTNSFPLYPPDITDYSILVLDPEAHQLVWTQVAIVDEKNKIQSENSTEPEVLPLLTEADLRENEICENTSISLGSQTEVNSGSLPRSQTKPSAKRTKKKPPTNFVLRPRKAPRKTML